MIAGRLRERSAASRDPLGAALAGHPEIGDDLGADPFFTARVLGSLPEPLRFTGLTPRRRMALLLGFQLGAACLAWVLWSQVGADTVADSVHDALGFAEREVGRIRFTFATAAVVFVAWVVHASVRRTR